MLTEFQVLEYMDKMRTSIFEGPVVKFVVSPQLWAGMRMFAMPYLNCETEPSAKKEKFCGVPIEIERMRTGEHLVTKIKESRANTRLIVGMKK